MTYRDRAVIHLGGVVSVQRSNLSNPYLFETATGLIGQQIVVQTAKNNQQGILTAVLPNHIVMERLQTPFFIHMEEIIWITLKPSDKFIKQM